MVYLVDFQHDGFHDVVNNQIEVGVSNPLLDILLAASEHIVDYSNLMALKHKAIDQIATNETGASSDEDSKFFALGKYFDRWE